MLNRRENVTAAKNRTKTGIIAEDEGENLKSVHIQKWNKNA